MKVGEIKEEMFLKYISSCTAQFYGVSNGNHVGFLRFFRPNPNLRVAPGSSGKASLVVELPANPVWKNVGLGGGNSNICYVHPYLRKISDLINIFQID